MKILIPSTTGPVGVILQGVPPVPEGFTLRDATEAEQTAITNGLNWYDAAAQTLVSPPAPVRTWTKLAIRRKLRAANLEMVLDAILSASAQAQADWADATVISSDDPMFQPMLEAFANAANLTTAEILTLLN